MAESTVAAVAAGQQILPLVSHLARVGRRTTDNCASGCLRPRYLIALMLLGDRGPMAQHAVGAALSLDPSNVVGLLNELEERGLITRRRDPADRRRHIVELSEAGADELARSNKQLDMVEDDLFKTLTAQERGTLYTLLARAVAALSPEHDAGEHDARRCGADAPDPCIALAPGE
jgi:DNA-binding MarR family transcriptional regulator